MNVNYIDDHIINYMKQRFIICYSLRKVSDYYWINGNVYTETVEKISNTIITINGRVIPLQICPTTDKTLIEIKNTIRIYKLNKLLLD